MPKMVRGRVLLSKRFAMESIGVEIPPEEIKVYFSTGNESRGLGGQDSPLASGIPSLDAFHQFNEQPSTDYSMAKLPVGVGKRSEVSELTAKIGAAGPFMTMAQELTRRTRSFTLLRSCGSSVVGFDHCCCMGFPRFTRFNNLSDAVLMTLIGQHYGQRW